MYDKKFYTLLDYVFAEEGGFSNHKNDRGGPTNFGIAQISLDEYTRKRNLPRKDVKNITKEEAAKIYYEDYYLKSGADKQKDIRDAYILFDTAVNFYPTTAKNMFKQANGNFYNMLDIRLKQHIKEAKDNPGQEEFKQGWINRVKRIEKRADELIKDPDFRPSYADEKTPFDDDYEGELKKINNISDPKEKQSLKNKYQYLLNKNGTSTGYAANIDSDTDTRTPSQKLDDEIREKYKRMKNQRLQRVFGKSKSNSSSTSGTDRCLDGSRLTALAKAWFCLSASARHRWVTINGNHVYIE